jgi:hypothetical protein
VSLSKVDRERISDSRLKIQSVTETLGDVDPDKIPHVTEIQECLADAERTLSAALRSKI